MTDYLHFAIRLFACALDIGLLYIWLRVFSKKRNYNRILTAAILFGATVAIYYVNRIEGSVLSGALELLCFALISVLAFEAGIKQLLFYTVINYVIGMAVEVLCCALPGMIAESTVKCIVFCLIMRAFYKRAVSCKSDEVSACMEVECSPWHYIAFYSVPIISFGSLTAIYILWNRSVIENSFRAYGLVAAAAVGLIIINAAVIYFFEDFAVMMAKNKKTELADTSSKLEQKYYTDLEAMHEQYDVYLHDMKHTMRTVAALAKEGKCEEIGHIIDDMRISLGSIDEQLVCSHKILNALFTERKGYAKDNGVILDIDVVEPLYFQEIDNLDLIVVMGNLLDNAIEAERCSAQKERITCNMHMAAGGRHMIIQIENSYEEKSVAKVKPAKRQSRIGEKHGIGLASTQSIVRKYGGIFENDQDDGRYKVKVILPVQSVWEDEESYTEPIPAYVQSAFK